MSSTSEVFSAFIEASKAIDELPKVRADLEAAQSLAEETEHKLRGERDQNNLLQNTLASLRADLSAREADLAQATKSRDELKAVVDLVRGSLPALPVAPSPNDRPSDMPAGPLSEASTEQGSSATDPTPWGQHNVGASGSSADTGPQEQSKPSHIETSENSGAGGWQGLRDADPTSIATANAPQPANADSPIAGTTTGQVSEDRETLGGRVWTVDDSVSAEPSPRPYANYPYWEKPSSMPWPQYIALGGAKPPWYDAENKPAQF